METAGWGKTQLARYYACSYVLNLIDHWGTTLKRATLQTPSVTSDNSDI